VLNPKGTVRGHRVRVSVLTRDSGGSACDAARVAHGAVRGSYSDAQASLAWRARIIQLQGARASPEAAAARARVLHRSVTSISLLDPLPGGGRQVR
jgi:hypothetical protein